MAGTLGCLDHDEILGLGLLPCDSNLFFFFFQSVVIVGARPRWIHEASRRPPNQVPREVITDAYGVLHV